MALFLSLLTYRMKDEVFRAWFHFAVWWVPVIIGVTLFFSNVGTGSGMVGAIEGAFTIMIISAFYYMLIAISLAKITETYLKLKWQEQNDSEAKLKKLLRIFPWVYRIIMLPMVLFFSWILFVWIF